MVLNFHPRFGGDFYLDLPILKGGKTMPSKQVLESKQAIVADLAEKIRKAQSGVIVKYEGITVGDDTEMRKKMREADVDYVVMKNTLTARACDEVGYGEIKEHLEGMNAIAISYKDPVAPAKILKEYAEKIETFEIRLVSGFSVNTQRMMSFLVNI